MMTKQKNRLFLFSSIYIVHVMVSIVKSALFFLNYGSGAVCLVL